MGGTGVRPGAERLKEVVRIGLATGGTPGYGPPAGVAASRRPPRRSVKAHAQSGGHCHVRLSRADWPAVSRDWPELSVRRRARRDPA